MYKEEFNPSQIMKEKYFEFHHTYTEEPLTVEFHQHPFYEIFFFLSGNVNYIIEGRTYNLRPGDILLTGSLDIHRPDIHPGKPYERIVIWLADDLFTQRLSLDPARQPEYHGIKADLRQDVGGKTQQRVGKLRAYLCLYDRISGEGQPRVLRYTGYD